MRVDLEELLRIWERWTDGDPVLRRANESYHEFEQAYARLSTLAHCGDISAAVCAAVNAGWAVLLALEDKEITLSTGWCGLCCDAHQAHQAALAAAHAYASTADGSLRRVRAR